MSGKYSSRLAMALDDITNNGAADDETGDVDTIGHYALFLFSGFTEEQRAEMVADWGKSADPGPDVVGAILYTDSQGFVEVFTYTSPVALALEWADLELEYADVMGEEEE